MKVISQHNRPLTINLLSGGTLRLDHIGHEQEITVDDAESPEFKVVLSRHQARILTPVPDAPANAHQASVNKKGK